MLYKGQIKIAITVIYGEDSTVRASVHELKRKRCYNSKVEGLYTLWIHNIIKNKIGPTEYRPTCKKREKAK